MTHDDTGQHRLEFMQEALVLDDEELFSRFSREFYAADASPPDLEADGRSRFRAITENLKKRICESAAVRQFCLQVRSSGPSVLTVVVVDQILSDLDRIYPGNALGFAAKAYLAALIAKNGIEKLCEGIAVS